MKDGLWLSTPPNYDETPISNIARNALLNHETALQGFFTDMQIDRQSIIDCLPDEIRRWANLIGVSSDEFVSGSI